MKAIMLALAAMALATLGSVYAARAEPPSVATPADPVRLQLARQLFEISGGEQAAKARIQIMFDGVQKTLHASMPADQAKLVDAIQRDIQDELLSMMPQLMESGERAYADVLTEKELRDYIAWLTSESGQAIVRKGPVIAREVLDLQRPLMAAMIPTVVQKVIDRACHEAGCSADERETVAALVTKALGGQKS